MAMLYASQAEVGKKYLTPKGLPVEALSVSGSGVLLKAIWTGNQLHVLPTYLLQPFAPEKLSREWRKISMATKAKTKKESKAIVTKVEEVDGKKYLSREYKGKEYKVTVRNAEDKKGFEYAGKLYRSLTDVARTITGQKIINGPKFFGLRQKAA